MTIMEIMSTHALPLLVIEHHTVDVCEACVAAIWLVLGPTLVAHAHTAVWRACAETARPTGLTGPDLAALTRDLYVAK